MVENTEADVRLLVQQVAKRAMLGGGMDRQTYDALSEASTALTALARAAEYREDALQALRARLRACGTNLGVRAA